MQRQCSFLKCLSVQRKTGESAADLRLEPTCSASKCSADNRSMSAKNSNLRASDRGKFRTSEIRRGDNDLRRVASAGDAQDVMRAQGPKRRSGTDAPLAWQVMHALKLSCLPRVKGLMPA